MGLSMVLALDKKPLDEEYIKVTQNNTGIYTKEIAQQAFCYIGSYLDGDSSMFITGVYLDTSAHAQWCCCGHVRVKWL